MTTAAQATAASAPAIVNGVTYLVTPLTDRQWAELDLWYQARFMRLARFSIDPDAPPVQRQEEIEQAFQTAHGLSFMRDVPGIFKSPDAFAQFAYQLLRKHHSEITPEQLKDDILKDPKGVEEIVAAWNLTTNGAKKNDDQTKAENSEEK